MQFSWDFTKKNTQSNVYNYNAQHASFQSSFKQKKIIYKWLFCLYYNTYTLCGVKKGFYCVIFWWKFREIDNNRWNFVKMKCAPGKICISVCILLLKTSSNILSPLEAKWCHRRRRLKTQKICMIISKFASMWRNKNFSFCERVHTVL